MKASSLILCLMSLAMMAGSPATRAQDNYPDRPISLVVPYQPGGTNDIIARVVGARLSDELGVPVVVDNRPGAGGNIGALHVARSAPDGYTFMVAPAGLLTVNPILYKSAGFSVKDFAPLTLAGSLPNVLLAHPSVSAASVSELISALKKDDGTLTFASMGSGTSGHLSAEMFKMMAGVTFEHVPYKGSAPALNDLMGGHVHLMFDNLPTALPLVQSGKLKALAVTSKTRSESLPAVATMDESGVSGYEATAWFGFVAPAATPPAVKEKLSKALIVSLRNPEVQDQLQKQGVDVVANSMEEFGSFIETEADKWGKVVEQSGMKVD